VKFFFYVWRYDKKTTESKRLSAYDTQEEAELVKEELAKDDSDGIYSVQEGND
jgi:hypothetical protein